MNVQLPDKLKQFAINPKRFNVLEGGRAGAKSHGVAELFLIWAMQEKKRFLCVREVQDSISQSVYQLLVDKIKLRKYPFQVLKNIIRCPLTGSEFLFHGLQDLTADNLKSFEGADWCWIEEAQNITKKSLDILVPTIRKAGSKLVFTMNRFEESDPVYEMFCMRPREDVLHIYTTYLDNPFCTKETLNDAEYCKVNAPDDYLHVWLGYPIQQGDNKVMKISKVKAAMERKVEAIGQLEIGVDVARFGDDRTVITPRKGFKTLGQYQYTKLRTFEVVDRAIEHENSDTMFKVDDTGVGGGVTDGLFQKGKNVIPINNGQVAKDKNKYPNAISEMWFEFAEKIDLIELPNNPELLKELCGREYTFDRQGRRCIESKDSFKKRYGRSPDLADSLLLAYYEMYNSSGFA